MINDYAADLAVQMGMKLSKVTITEGMPLGCTDSNLLELTSKGKTTNALIHSIELENLKNGACNDLLELKVSSALDRLKMLLEV